MYTSDTTAASQGNTKNTIQALLKQREKRPFINKSPTDSANDKIILSTASGSPDFTVTKPTHLEFESKSQSSPEHIQNSSTLQENLDYQKDFNYSQKLFHIADGNLYSIFSPIQGRSYGMKPSFLRKQKYTVQECHSRGRKNLRKGLKFHNFLPSESVTSEKDNGFLHSKWKVHSECRLREEHGTKQITISNWSQCIQNPDETSHSAINNLTTASSSAEANSTNTTISKSEDSRSDCKSNINDPYDFNLCLQQNGVEGTDPLTKINKNETLQSPSASVTKKDSLNFVLNSLIEKPSLSRKKNSSSDEIEIISKSFQKHRRKPVQTRRIVPYVKYLSIMEENESLPLDLSSKCLIDNSSSTSLSIETLNTSGKNDFDLSDSMFCNDKHANLRYSTEKLTMPSVPGEKMATTTSLNVMQTQVTTPVTVTYPVPFNKGANLEQNKFQESSNHFVDVNPNQDISNSCNTSNKSYNLMSHSLQNNAAFSVQKSLVKEIQSKPRKRNQRSVIKQKLEDTFRQNGFLVKTKQVSDGEATFCKFRQLRKYTRYYLKSLEQHLPDEFHKMWKGFLPPKTVLPPALGTPEPTDSA